MAIKQKHLREGKIEIDLTGQDGNSYALLAYAKRFSRQLGLDFNKISKEMRESNYDNLIGVFDRYFGEYVDLLR